MSKINNVSSINNKKLKLSAAELYNSLILFLGSEYLSKINSQEKIEDDSRSLEELLAELNSFIGLKNVKDKILDYFSKQVELKNEGFANGRLARNLFDDMILNHAKRVINLKEISEKNLSMLTGEDFLSTDIK